MIKIIINDRIVVINPEHITHVELSSNKEIEIGVSNTHNLYIEISEIPDVIVEVTEATSYDSNVWKKIIENLLNRCKMK